MYYIYLLILLILVTPVAAKTYTETSEKSIVDFSGKMTVTFDTNPDQSISGVVEYRLLEQGWTIKLKGKIQGSLIGDTAVLTSNTPIKYGGKDYTVKLDIKATYDPVSDTFVGTKTGTLLPDGNSGSSPFRATLK